MKSIIYLFFVGSFLVLLHAAPGPDDPDPPKPSLTVTIEKLTVRDQETLAKTGRLSVISVGNGIYVPGPIRYPCGQTWSNFWLTRFWYYQCLANFNCKPYIGCWCNRCACYTFIVNPTSPPCKKWNPWPIGISSLRVDGYLSADDEGGK